MAPKYFSWLGIQKSSPPLTQKDIKEMKTLTLQIAQDWIEMMKVMTSIRDDRYLFEELGTQIESRVQTLCQNITICLEEEFLRNDQRWSKIGRIIDVMQEDILIIKNLVQKPVGTLYPDAVVIENKVIDSYAQTDYEIKGHVKEKHRKNSTSQENEGSRFANTVKKCLADLIKDTKLHLSIDREEENRELEIILSKLTEDREDIKRTIVQAFSLAAEDAKKNFNQFVNIGQEAMHYMAVLNENTNKMLQIKLEETDGRLKEILNALNRQNLDVGSIRETLENLDGQFDDIFQRVELGHQRNTENCEEMTQNLEKASNHWASTAVELGEMAKNFTNDTKMMKDILNEVKTVVDSIRKEKESYHSAFSENDEVVQFDSIASSTTQDLWTLAKKHRNLIFMYSMIQACWEKLSCMNNRVENGCGEICLLIETLAQKLQSLNSAVEKLDEVIRGVDEKNIVGRVTCAKCSDANSEEIEHMVKTKMYDGGDCQPQVYQMATATLSKETEAQKLQATIATEEIKMIELILKSVSEQRNSDASRNSTDDFEQIEECILFDTEESQNRDTDEVLEPDCQMVAEQEVESDR